MVKGPRVFDPNRCAPCGFPVDLGGAGARRANADSSRGAQQGQDKKRGHSAPFKPALKRTGCKTLLLVVVTEDRQPKESVTMFLYQL
jgi:hypothetical protein